MTKYDPKWSIMIQLCPDGKYGHAWLHMVNYYPIFLSVMAKNNQLRVIVAKHDQI